jgi:ABC-type amino acid transport substrate-binding protein
VAFSVPPDKAGAKNDIQAIKSSVTYAKAVTYESVCGMAASDANVDDDANGAATKTPAKAQPKEKIVGPRFDQALAAIRAGKYDAIAMRDYYQLTPDQDAALSDLEKEMARA